MNLEPIYELLHECIEVSRRSMLSDAVIGFRMLAHRDRLADAFFEIAEKLKLEAERRTLLGLVMSSGAPWSLDLQPPEAAREVELLHLNRQIAAASTLLGGLLRRREEMSVKGPIRDTVYWPADAMARVFQATGKQTGVAAGLLALQGAFNTDHWPSMPDICKVIALNAEAAMKPEDLPFEVLNVMPPRERARRFVHTLLQAMRIGNAHVFPLPEDFYLSDATLTALTNVALDLHAPDSVMASEIRGLRPWIYPWEEEP